MRRHRVVAVELPVRIIRREQEHLIGADLLDHVGDACGIRRAVERLHGDADMVADDRSRLALDPRHLDAHAAPGLVGAPHEGRQPAHAGFHQHHLEAGEFAEHAFVDQREDLRLKSLRLGQIIFVAMRRPADRARRAPILAAGVDRDRQFVFLGGLIDRPVMPSAEQALALRQHQDGDEAGVAGSALDLLDGEVRRLHRHHDRGAQARIARQPFCRDPVVDRLAEGGRHVGIVDGLRAVQHVADRVRCAELVERAMP